MRWVGQCAERVPPGLVSYVHHLLRGLGQVLREAVRQGRQFSVIVTECSPDRVGVEHQAKTFSELGIPVTVVSDAAVAAVMDKVDLALVGAEAVVESHPRMSTRGALNTNAK